MADRLILKNMVFYGYHGVFDAEKELGQRIEVDVELYLNLKPAGSADDLELAVNYVEIYTIVKDIVEERGFNLMEALADTIAEEILSAYTLDEIVVRVRKPNPPSGGIMDYLEVEVRRPANKISE
ncbi:MAG TPA: dihydroneopterin aldolase [Bacillota bacterium]